MFKQYKELTDESIMPWGKHKGKELQEVPGYYLIWLERKILDEGTTPHDIFKNGLLVYISENRDVIEMQAKNNK